MFIFKNKKKSNEKTPETPVPERCSSEVSPKKSIESSLARALALENLLVAGHRNSKQNSKSDEKKYLKILQSPKIKFSEKYNIFHQLLGSKKISENIRLLEVFFQWSVEFIAKKKFLLLLSEVFSIGFIENSEINDFVDVVCKNCEATQKESYRLTGFYFFSHIVQLKVPIWSERIMSTLCICFQPKKILDIVLLLLNSETGYLHLMNLIKLILEESNALILLKEVFCGKLKIEKFRPYQPTVFMYILQCPKQNIVEGVLDDFIKAIDENKLSENEVSLFEEIKEYSAHS